MVKLVVLSPGMTGRTHELTADKATIGRFQDNTFQIADPSVSSHHCELMLRGGEVIVHDLNSTNGTYVSGVEVNESVLKPGQILRLGQIEMRLETELPAAPAKKQLDRTTVIPGGVSKSELDRAHDPGKPGTQGPGFSKKRNRVNEVFIILSVVLGMAIGALLLYLFTTIRW
jgi:predicted component of type VI protein secretion system